MPLSPGQVINNRYRIVSLLGQGGYGAVYKAWDLTFELPCAVKENTQTSPDAQKQFLREARLLRTLRHPNLPQVSDYFILPAPDEGSAAAADYLVMDFIAGEDLEHKLHQRQQPFEEAQALGWIAQICDALAYLHAQNPPVIHRDVKPANIKITPEGQAVLVDFGIAKASAPGLTTATGARAITSGYSPLEQYGAGGTDARSDLYSLGATLYTLLTDLVPQEATTRGPHAPLRLPRTANPLISERVETAILRALELFPEDRFQSVAEFKAALLASGPAAPAPAPSVQTVARPVESAPSVHAWQAPSPDQPPQGPSSPRAAPSSAPQQAPAGPPASSGPPRAAGPSRPTSSVTPPAPPAGRSRTRLAGACALLAIAGLATAVLLGMLAYRLVLGGISPPAVQVTRTSTSQLSAVMDTPAGPPEASAAAPGPEAAATGVPAAAAPLQPVELPDGDTVTLRSTTIQYRYTILSAERRPLADGRALLHLRLRAWTDSGGGMNFWSDSFRLYAGELRLAPVNSLNEVVGRDQTGEGDVEFEIDAGLSEALLVIYGYGETQQLRLVFPQPAGAAQAITPAPTPTLAGARPVALPEGDTVTLRSNTIQYRYTILTAERRPLGGGKLLLHLRLRAWTDSGGGMNFWSDSFRLKIGDLSLAPVNNLNELVYRDQTVDGDVEFEIDAALAEALLVVTAYGETQQLPLVFP